MVCERYLHGESDVELQIVVGGRQVGGLEERLPRLQQLVCIIVRARQVQHHRGGIVMKALAQHRGENLCTKALA